MFAHVQFWDLRATKIPWNIYAAQVFLRTISSLCFLPNQHFSRRKQITLERSTITEVWDLKVLPKGKKKNSPLRTIHLPTSCQQQEANNRVLRKKPLTNNSATTLIPQGAHRHQAPFSPGSIFWLFWPPVSLPCNTSHHLKHPSWKYSNCLSEINQRAYD